jgi:hypothetical protein
LGFTFQIVRLDQFTVDVVYTHLSRSVSRHPRALSTFLFLLQ